MGGFRDMWAQVDEMTTKSKRQYETTKLEVEAVSGWKFKGCDNGMWKARNSREGIDVSDRDPEQLVKRVKRGGR